MHTLGDIQPKYNIQNFDDYINSHVTHFFFFLQKQNITECKTLQNILTTFFIQAQREAREEDGKNGSTSWN